MTKDNGRLPVGTGPSSVPDRAAEGVSPLRASVPSAESFARSAHRGQEYNGEPYVDAHVSRVVEIVRAFGYGGAYEAAAWLHDVVEDTDTRIQQIAEEFGAEVAQLVWACTGIGHNRKARNATIYDKIAHHPRAAVVKLADRIANVEASAPESGHRAMYRKEMAAFEAVIRPHVPAKMWDRLAQAIEARSDTTEGRGPQGESAVLAEDAPTTHPEAQS